MNKPKVNILTILIISFLAVFSVQIIHESTHAIAALGVGAKVLNFSVFAINSELPENAVNKNLKEGIIDGSAAIINIILGFLAIYFLQLG